MFSWFKKKNTHEEWDEEYTYFLKGIARQNQPRIYQSFFAYVYTIKLNFPEVQVEVKYDSIRKKWDISTWSNEALTFLFYYDYLNKKPTKAIDFILCKYDLEKLVEDMLAKQNEKKAKQSKVVDKLISKYTRK